jgi:hypothetical protein
MDKIWRLFSGNSNILKFLLSPVRFTKCLGVRVPLRPPRKKALGKIHGPVISADSQKQLSFTAVVTYYESQEMLFPFRQEKYIKVSNHPAPCINMLILYQFDDMYCNNLKSLYVSANIFKQSTDIY